MPIDSDDRMIAPGGYYYNNTTDARTSLRLYGLLISEDAVFTALEVDDSSVFASWNLSGATIPTNIGGLFAPLGSQITAYTLASGSVLELKEFA